MMNLDLVDLCFTESSNLSDEERSPQNYICGYVALKERLGTYIVTSCENERVFRVSIKRKALYFYTFFKLREMKCSEGIFIEAYKMIYESTSNEFENINNIGRRISNCLFKGFAKKEFDEIQNIKDKKSLKKRKPENI